MLNPVQAEFLRKMLSGEKRLLEFFCLFLFLYRC